MANIPNLPFNGSELKEALDQLNEEIGLIPGGGGGPTIPTESLVTVYTFSGNGSNTLFAFPETGAYALTIFAVMIDGVYQARDSYTATNTNITFDQAPPAGTDNIEVVVGSGHVSSSHIAIDGGTTQQPLGSKLRLIADVRDWGIKMDSENDYSTEMQAAIDELASTTIPEQGGTLYVPPGVVYATGLEYKDFVYIKGAGQTASVIKCPSNLNQNVLTVPANSSGNGLFDITLMGRRLTEGNEHCLVFEDSSGGENDIPFPFRDKDPQLEGNVSKFFHGAFFCTGWASGNGIWKKTGGGYRVYLTQFESTYNLGHGIYWGGTDSEISNFYSSHNGYSGLIVVNGANKITSGKVIWNNRRKQQWAGMNVRKLGVVPTANLAVIGVEAQDNFGHGFDIEDCEDSIFHILSNRNGYKEWGDNTSDRVSANYRFNDCSRISVVGASFTYESAVGSDGFWTTEYPYRLDGTNDFLMFYISEDGRTNQAPTSRQTWLVDGPHSKIVAQSGDGQEGLLDISPKSPTGNGECRVRLFRGTTTIDEASFDVHRKNSTGVSHRLTSQGRAWLCLDNADNVRIGAEASGGAWNTPHIELGPYHLWIDANDRLRIKEGAPTSQDDGTIVGSQS